MRILNVLGLLATLFSPSARAEEAYFCLQPGDETFLTLPAIEWPATRPALREEYAGPELFAHAGGGNAIFTFSPAENLELTVSMGDFEEEIFPVAARFLISEEKLYTWVTLRAPTHGGGIVRSATLALKRNGVEIARSRPTTIEVREALESCDY